jgi:hypothetical protein
VKEGSEMSEIASIIQGIIPISSFNRGQAGKIFDEVKSGSTKVVVKNNEPESILISPQKYIDLLQKLEDMEDIVLAMERENSAFDEPSVGFDELLKEAGLTREELSSMGDVEFD